MMTLEDRVAELERIVAQLQAKQPRAKNVTWDELIDAGLAGDTATDFLAHRRQIKAPLTHTALRGIQREVDKAGIGLEAAVTMMMARGWRGFQAEWVPANKADAVLRRNRQAGDDWISGSGHAGV